MHSVPNPYGSPTPQSPHRHRHHQRMATQRPAKTSSSTSWISVALGSRLPKTQHDYSTELSMKIGVGMFLLYVNILTFSGVYYYKKDNRHHKPCHKPRPYAGGLVGNYVSTAD